MVCSLNYVCSLLQCYLTIVYKTHLSYWTYTIYKLLHTLLKSIILCFHMLPFNQNTRLLLSVSVNMFQRDTLAPLINVCLIVCAERKKTRDWLYICIKKKHSLTKYHINLNTKELGHESLASFSGNNNTTKLQWVNIWLCFPLVTFWMSFKKNFFFYPNWYNERILKFRTRTASTIVVLVTQLNTQTHPDVVAT